VSRPVIRDGCDDATFMAHSLLQLESGRADLLEQLPGLGDVRPGSFSATQGRGAETC
jgi:hypothetical protein